MMLTVAGRAAAVRSVRVGGVFTGVVLTVVRHTPCWLQLAAHTPLIFMMMFKKRVTSCDDRMMILVMILSKWIIVMMTRTMLLIMMLNRTVLVLMTG